MKKFLSILILMSISMTSVYSQIWTSGMSDVNKENFNSMKSAFDQYWKDKEPAQGSGYKQFKRWEDFWEARVDADGNFPDGLQIKRNWENYLAGQKGNSILSEKANWIQRGPIGVPDNILSYKSSGLGRINTIAFHPTNINLFWIGAASGGAWFTEDGGKSWTGVPITQFLNIGVSDIAISESDPDVIFIATGDANGITMTRNYSIGVIKSTDAGKTWSETQLTNDISERILCNRLIIDPQNPDRVFAATNKGIYRTTDGGANWDLITGKSYYRDLEFNPINSNILYASTYGNQAFIAYSNDGGDTWTENRDIVNSNRIALAVSKADPDRVYAIASLQGSSKFLGLYISEDDAFSWEVVSNDPNLFGLNLSGDSPYNLGWYAMAFNVSQMYSDVLFAGCINSWRSSNGGSKWNAIAHWQGRSGLNYVHADNHFYGFQPVTDHLFACNDGGIYKSIDYGETWEDISNGLPIAQIYRIGVSQMDNSIVTGMQDNGSNIIQNGNWKHINGGDGMECIIDYSDPDIVYCAYQNGSIFRLSNNFSRVKSIISTSHIQEYGAWITPYIIDPINPETLYAGYWNLWKSDDRGDTWQKLTNLNNTQILSIAVASSNNKYIYFSKDKVVYKTTDGGASVSLHQTFTSRVTDIEIDPNNPERYWVTLSNYSASNKVYEINGDETTDISQNLPKVPVNTIAYYKDTEDKMFIGTDLGVFYRDKFMDQWELFNDGMPNILIYELEIKYDTKELYAGTFARGLWSTFIQDCEIEEPLLIVDGQLEFCEGDSLIIDVENDYSSYLWSNGEIESKITIKESGTYYVTVKDEEGCTSYSEEIKVVVYDVPNNEIIISQNPPYCVGDTVVLTVDENIESIEWSNGSKEFELIVTDSINLSYNAVSVNGCSVKSDEYIFAFFEKPEKPSVIQIKGILRSTPAYRYEWHKNDLILHLSKGQELTINSPGQYHVVTYNEAGCGTESDKIDVITSVEIDDSFISISPNPFADRIVISIDNSKIFDKIIVLDLLGNEVFIKSIATNDTSFEYDLRSLVAGSYTIVLYFGQEFITKQLIKE